MSYTLCVGLMQVTEVFILHSFQLEKKITTTNAKISKKENKNISSTYKGLL